MVGWIKSKANELNVYWVVYKIYAGGLEPIRNLYSLLVVVCDAG